MLRATHNQIVRSLQILNHILSLYGIYYVLTHHNQFTWLVVSLISFWITGVFGINIGLHRLLSHRSFKTHIYIEYLLTIISVITVVGSPLAWIAIHRQHHRTCETNQDPHSPYILGNFRAWFGLWNYVKLDIKLIKDLRKVKFHKWIHKYYLGIILIYMLSLFLLNPLFVIFIYALPACLCLHSTSAIIVIAHRHGYKTYSLGHDESRNSWIASIITLGEGWHNNHHAHPNNWKQGEFWWEFDPTAWVIKLLKYE